ncbi:MAG TPA: hypothetical protein DEG28_03225 [Porphyromonadaceae bacterium]|jgi:hypothetical protein|nr:hypothetical protein [Porphyromonadaceae bacterium]HBX44883.1 hypothetical protein [Porphyromonadaceae bacterium]HCM19769.1 hypothetical protein [Porphyromonadaceae bacterium]
MYIQKKLISLSTNKDQKITILWTHLQNIFFKVSITSQGENMSLIDICALVLNQQKSFKSIKSFTEKKLTQFHRNRI